MGNRMNATEMRELTDQAREQKAIDRQKDSAAEEIRQQKIAASTKDYWLTVGIPQLEIAIKLAAEDGKSSYEEVIDVCPDYVVNALKDKGYKVKRTTERRGVRLGRGDVRYWAHVVVIGW